MYIINIFDPNLWSFWIAGTEYGTRPIPRKSAKSWAQAEKADLVWNLSLFDLKEGYVCTFVRGQGVDFGYGGTSERIEFNIKNKAAGYEVGIRSGLVVSNNFLGGKRTRCGIGKTTSGYIIVAQSSSKVTEKAFCTAVNKYVTKHGKEVDLFLMEDGGGSTQQYSAISKLTFAPEGGRAIPAVLCAKYIGTRSVTRNLMRGCKGDDVSLLQTVLGGIEVDGTFGPATRDRLILAQISLGLKADGSCGPATRSTLHI